MDPKPAIAIADVLEAQRLVWTDTTHNPGWVVPTPGGGAVVHAGSTDVHVGALDRLWVRDRADGGETHIDLPPGALPARAGHTVAAVSLDGEAAAWANLATGDCHHVAERAPALEGRLAEWPVLAGLAGLLAAALAAGSGPGRPALTPAGGAALPRTVCDIGPGELCDRYAADLRARAPVWGRGGRWAAATRDAFDWAASQNGGRGLDGLSPSRRLDRALEAPQLARLSAVERAEWRRAMEAHWRVTALDGPYERALRRARGMDWPSRAPRVIFLVLVAAGPALVVLLAVRNAVANARRRDEAVDATVAAVLAGGIGPAAM